MPPVVRQAARALRKRAKVVLNFAGADGADGPEPAHGAAGDGGAHGDKGKDGNEGRPGKNGRDGKKGRAGKNGKNGKKGANGGRGGRGCDVTVTLSGTPKALTLNGTVLRYPADGGDPVEEAIIGPVGPLDMTRKGDTTSVVRIVARGGNGGAGSAGGNGGNGGRGGDGGAGGNGGNGKKGMKPGMGGEHGGHGGPGGLAGPGGKGGNGAAGRNGGNSGRGGVVTIRAQDPSLFVLVEAVAVAGRAGSAGKGGAAGVPGAPGMPGPGGQGGQGGMPWDRLWLARYNKWKDVSYRVDKSRCIPGNPGMQGPMGPAAPPAEAGMKGEDGSPGKTASNGKVIYQLVDGDGAEVAAAPERYTARVLKYRVDLLAKNGVWAPGAKIRLSGIVVKNDGKFALPAGATISVPENEFVQEDPEAPLPKPGVALPALEPGEKVTVDAAFAMRIRPMPQSFPGAPFVSRAVIAPRVTLMGRAMPESELPTRLHVRFPVRIVNGGDSGIEAPHHMSPGQVASVSVHVRNVSLKSLGTSPGTPVAVRLLGENGISVVGTALQRIKTVKAGADAVVKFRVRCDAYGAGRDMQLQAHLLLRGRSVEYRHQVVVVSPVYDPARNADITLVVPVDLPPPEAVAWVSIAQTLGLSLETWTCKTHGTLAQPLPLGIDDDGKPKWHAGARGKLLVVPVTDPSRASMLGAFIGPALAEHLGAPALDAPRGGLLLAGVEAGDALDGLIDLSRPEKQTPPSGHERHHQLRVAAEAEAGLFNFYATRSVQQTSGALYRYPGPKYSSCAVTPIGRIAEHTEGLPKPRKLATVDASSRLGAAVVAVVHALPLSVRLRLLAGTARHLRLGTTPLPNLVAASLVADLAGDWETPTDAAPVSGGVVKAVLTNQAKLSAEPAVAKFILAAYNTFLAVHAKGGGGCCGGDPKKANKKKAYALDMTTVAQLLRAGPAVQKAAKAECAALTDAGGLAAANPIRDRDAAIVDIP